MKKKFQSSQVVTVVVLSALTLGIFLSIFGLSRAINGIDETVISKTPEAILASAGVSEGKNVSLPVAYFDQRADQCVNLYDKDSRKALANRQFEWISCGYTKQEIEKGLVEYNLGSDFLPVGVEGKLASNLGLSNLKRWFSTVEGKSQEYVGTIDLKYHSDGVEFSYLNNDFYPIDDVKFSSDDAVNVDGHNHLFTMNFAIPFTVMASGAESFEISADDDTFVYLGNDLIIDLGGIHGVASGKFEIKDNGEVYTSDIGKDLAYSGINLKKDEPAIIRIFHADRDSFNSVFKLKTHGMNLNVVKTELAGNNNGVQVAYDPTDPSFVAPLGQTKVVRPDGTKGFIVMATIESVLIIAFSIFIIMAIRAVRKQKN